MATHDAAVDGIDSAADVDIDGPTLCQGPAPNGSTCPPGYCNICMWLDFNPTPGCPPRFCYRESTLSGAQCTPVPCMTLDAGD